jgi:hypothetical protein
MVIAADIAVTRSLGKVGTEVVRSLKASGGEVRKVP